MESTDAAKSLFDADSTLFTCTVAEPNRGRIGTVTARKTGTDTEVGRLVFAVQSDAGKLEAVRYSVHPDCVLRGCARELTKALRRYYPDRTLSTSIAKPTRLGRKTMLRLFEDGYIDALGVDLYTLDPADLEGGDDAEQWAGITKEPSPCSAPTDEQRPPGQA